MFASWLIIALAFQNIVFKIIKSIVKAIELHRNSTNANFVKSIYLLLISIYFILSEIVDYGSLKLLNIMRAPILYQILISRNLLIDYLKRYLCKETLSIEVLKNAIWDRFFMNDSIASPFFEIFDQIAAWFFELLNVRDLIG